MPYQWTEPHSDLTELRLWPHQSLPPRGFAAFILTTFTLSTVPLYGLLGTAVLWGLLPFMLLTLGGIYFALRRNEADRQVTEVLTLTGDEVRLVRRAARKAPQEWQCNAYWTRVACHKTGGPVPHYVTLAGAGREVEIGAFLSEEERKDLFDDLTQRMQRATHAR